MKNLVLISLVVVLAACSSDDTISKKPPEYTKKYPVVTIETSGDLYYEDGGSNIQMDLFGNCAPGKNVIYIEVDKKRSATQCQNGRYRYSLNLPKTFFDENFAKVRNPTSQYMMKEVQAYHQGHQKLNATSYILIDRKKKEVKSVINKQVRFEKIPTGDYEPITQYNAFGSCDADTVVTLDIKAPDRFGHERSKYDVKKACQQSGGFYFLSQIHGYPKKGTTVYLFEDKKVAPDSRQPASEQKVRYKNIFKWPVSVD